MSKNLIKGDKKNKNIFLLFWGRCIYFLYDCETPSECFIRSNAQNVHALQRESSILFTAEMTEDGSRRRPTDSINVMATPTRSFAITWLA